MCIAECLHSQCRETFLLTSSPFNKFVANNNTTQHTLFIIFPAVPSLTRHLLISQLDGSLRASNAQFEPPYVLNRINVRLLTPNPGETGWEIFTLEYFIDTPLNAVVSSGD